MTKAQKAKYDRARRKKNAKRIAKQQAAWRRKNRKYFAAYLKKNAAHIAKRQAVYYRKNRKRITKQHAVYRHKNAVRVVEWRAAWEKANPELVLLMKAKHRAKKFAVPFNLTVADIVIPKRCPVLDIPLFKGKGRLCPNSPSLDRVIPELGYVRGNINVISMFANVVKNDKADPSILRRMAKQARCEYPNIYERIARYIEKHQRKIKRGKNVTRN